MPAAMLAIGDVSVLEGNGGTHNAVVAVTLTEPHGNSITVGYRTADGTAIAGSDYNAVSGKLTFARNEMSKSILVPVIGDRTPEADKTFFVRLSNPKGAKIADGEGIVTIVEDEPRISISDAWSYGDMSPFTFTVSLSAAYDQAVTVNFATADGTALAGVDYVATSGTLTFAPGETTKTITVAVIDTTAAPDKWFTVHLSSASTLLLPDGPVIFTGHDRSHPHPVRHRARRSARRGATFAAGLRRAAQAGGAETRPRETRANATGHGPSPRSLRRV